MKSLIIILAFMFSSASFAGEGVRREYDELMKKSGKWSFISSSFFACSLLTGAASVYAHDQRKYYVDRKKNVGFLTEYEKEQYDMWTNARDIAGWSTAGLLVLSLYGNVVELNYENRAHQFAIDMKVEF